MFTASLWSARARLHGFQLLSAETDTEVAVIGAGITGLSTAQALAELGLSVVVLEAGKVGGGATAHSTGNLYHCTDQHLGDLISKYDEQKVRQVIAARAEALDRIRANVSRYELDCDYISCPLYKYATTEETAKLIDNEISASRRTDAGLETADPAELPFAAKKALKINEQAQFNPMAYVQELAAALQALHKNNLRIFECSGVNAIEYKNGVHVLSTSGGKVRAKYLVHATHTPKGIKFVQTLLAPYREYGIACRITDPFPPGIFWGYLSDTEKISTRVYNRNGERFLVVVGEPHKVGQETDTSARIRKLEKFARNHFKILEVSFRWGGQHYRPADLLPYIGRIPGEETSYIASGFSTDGLTYGTLAGIMIAGEISGIENTWSGLFDAARHQPLKAAKNFISENLNVMAQYAKNLPGAADVKDTSEIRKGEGRVLDQKGKKIAAYRDENGKLHFHAAVCTHMACIVNWNNAEKSWDCPCHGSRFKCDGTVLEGPAIAPLKVIDGPG